MFSGNGIFNLRRVLSGHIRVSATFLSYFFFLEFKREFAAACFFFFLLTFEWSTFYYTTATNSSSTTSYSLYSSLLTGWVHTYYGHLITVYTTYVFLVLGGRCKWCMSLSFFTISLFFFFFLTFAACRGVHCTVIAQTDEKRPSSLLHTAKQ